MTTRDDVAAFNEAFSAAMARQDIDRVLDSYTDDARLLFHGMPMVRGRAAIDALLRPDLEEAPNIIRFESLEVLEGGSLIVDIGRYITPNGTGKYVVVHERQPDGSLRMAIDTATSDGPAASADEVSTT